MSKYELCVVLSARLEEDDRAAAMEQIKGYITRFGGTVTDVEEWGKKRLAYEIQKMHEGFYYFVHFEAEPACPGEVEKSVRIMESVIRYLIVKPESTAAAPEAQEPAEEPAQEPAEAEEA